MENRFVVARGQEQGRRVREVGVVLRAAHVLSLLYLHRGGRSSKLYMLEDCIKLHTHMHTHNTQLNTHTQMRKDI